MKTVIKKYFVYIMAVILPFVISGLAALDTQCPLCRGYLFSGRCLITPFDYGRLLRDWQHYLMPDNYILIWAPMVLGIIGVFFGKKYLSKHFGIILSQIIGLIGFALIGIFLGVILAIMSAH
ncbi:MAG: hypothetical protein KAS87_03000 [Candidatus Omnitrophica bacterium]|nr:hypothetical protein [Candidatus Omnitrophota bacterium]